MAPPVRAELFTERRHIVVELVNLSETGGLVCWSTNREPSLSVGDNCDLLVHISTSKKRFPRIPATVRHRRVRQGLCCVGLELHVMPNIVHAGVARELRRLWIDAQRQELRRRREER